jgi:hypothetical protein
MGQGQLQGCVVCIALVPPQYAPRMPLVHVPVYVVHVCVPIRPC